MTNYINTEKVDQIRRLAAEGKSLRQIAKAVGCSSNTVVRYLPQNKEAVEADYQLWLQRVGRPRGSYNKRGAK